MASDLFCRCDFFLGRLLLDLSWVLPGVFSRSQMGGVPGRLLPWPADPYCLFSRSARGSGAPPAVGNCRL